MKGFLKIAGILGLAGGLLYWERRLPLRVKKESRSGRTARNLAVATLGALTVHLVEWPVLYPLGKKVENKRWGLVKRLHLPRVIETLVALALLDYTLYLQHV